MKQNLQVCLLSMACLMFLTPNVTVAQTFKEEEKPELSQLQKLEHACLGKSCECGANGKIKVEGKSESLSSPDFATLRFTVTPTPDNNKTADIVDTFVKNLDAAKLISDKDEVVVTPSISHEQQRHIFKANILDHKIKRKVTLKDGEEDIKTFDIKVVIHDVNNVYKVTQIARDSGVTINRGFEFNVNDINTLQDDVNLKAVEDARNHASKLADSLNLKLGRVCKLDVRNDLREGCGREPREPREFNPNKTSDKLKLKSKATVVFELNEK